MTLASDLRALGRGGGLPALDGVALPPAVRAGGAEERQLYAGALGFERELFGQLARELESTARGDDEERSAATGTYGQLVPGALADGVIASGASGLAEELYRQLRLSPGPAGARPDGKVDS